MPTGSRGVLQPLRWTTTRAACLVSRVGHGASGVRGDGQLDVGGFAPLSRFFRGPIKLIAPAVYGADPPYWSAPAARH
jgi:hypothetical protein